MTIYKISSTAGDNTERPAVLRKNDNVLDKIVEGKTPYLTIGENIKKIREKRGESQANISKNMGLRSHKNISDWEHGRKKPSYHNLIGLCYALKVTPNKLLQWDKETDDYVHKSELDKVKKELKRYKLIVSILTKLVSMYERKY